MQMPAFRSQYQARAEQRYHASVGSPEVQQYRPMYDSDGVLQLEPTVTHDLYAEIQSYAASCDLQYIINRYFNGDASALSRVQGVYADLTGMPDSIHGVYNLMQQARADFGALPAEIKDKFGNDVMRFLASLGTPEWRDAMQIKAKPEVPTDGEAAKDVVSDALNRAAAVRESEG